MLIIIREELLELNRLKCLLNEKLLSVGLCLCALCMLCVYFDVCVKKNNVYNVYFKTFNISKYLKHQSVKHFWSDHV